MKMTRSIRFKSKFMVASLSALAALVIGAPAFAAGGHFTAQLCGVNVRDLPDSTGVNEIYKGLWTHADGSTTDAFLIRYYDGKHETYLSMDVVMDKVLGILFYDVQNLKAPSSSPFLSFGIDEQSYIIGDTTHGDKFAATLHPTQSDTTCINTPPAS
jgi:hypothetical protein